MNIQAIKELSNSMNLQEVCNEANRLGAKKRPKVELKYEAVYAQLTRGRSKYIHPLVAEAVETLAQQKMQSINDKLKEINDAEKSF